MSSPYAEVLAALRDRRTEIEEGVRERVWAISDPLEESGPEYAEGVRLAVCAAIDYGLQGIEYDDDRFPPVPPVLLSQARIAARNSVSLDTVLRRYLGGYTLLGDFLVEEAVARELTAGELKGLLRTEAALLDRLLAAIGEEYAREKEARFATAEHRRADQIRALLAGERLDAPGLAYELRGWHLGLIATGPKAHTALRDLAAACDRRLLALRRENETVWAWLGGRKRLELEVISEKLSAWPAEHLLTLGEPAEDLPGWRLTHRQALAAIPIAQRGEEDIVRYADSALLASALQDHLLVALMRNLYLDPLSHGRDGGEALRDTLHAYFAADRNVSAAAASLGVNRHTFRTRLHTAEERLGRPLGSVSAHLEIALSLDRLQRPSSSPN